MDQDTQTHGQCPFVPPYPIPHKNKNSLIKRFFTGQISWLHTLFERSYKMKMGEIKLPKLDFFLINEPSLIKKVMIDEVAKFPKHHLLEQLLEPLVGRSIFAVSSHEWERQRKMVYPAFTHTNLRRTFDVMQAATDDMIDQIRQKLRSKKTICIDPIMTFVTADIIYRTLFSVKLTLKEADKIYKAFHDFQSAVQPCAILKIYGLPTWYHRYKIKRATQKIHAVFSPIIQKRYDDYQKTQIAGNDILGSLLEARDAQTGQPFNMQELIDQISTVFLAGHETSASTLSWALYLLGESPEIQENCYAQIPKGYFQVSDLKQMSNLKNLFDETLRLYPPVAFFLREASCPVKMRTKNISKGSMIAISPWLMQRNPLHWEQPHHFNPQRFEDPETQKAQKEAYFPFGKGPRICVGAAFAKQESLIILAKILQNFTIQYNHQKKPIPVSKVTLRAKKGIFLKFTPRDMLVSDD